MNLNPLLLTDFYKTAHFEQYPKGTTVVYSNLTARKSRLPNIDSVVFFGLQYFVQEYLIDAFNENFFSKPWEEIESEYLRHVHVSTDHIKSLHELGYLPIRIKAIPEGTKVPIRVACLTIQNTHSDFMWLTNYIETLLSAVLWMPITSATIADRYRQIMQSYLLKTVGDDSLLPWLCHDFSARGMSSVESMVVSGMAHLTSFCGTDTVPAIYALEKYYDATGLIGGSVSATEHSVMCSNAAMGETIEQGEFDCYKTLINEVYPSGIVSIVSDTYDLWRVLTDYLPRLKNDIESRDGKLVIRPDSGDPCDIICGDNTSDNPHARKGVYELLWDVFGGTVVNGYKVLNQKVGAIYGDSITIERVVEISERLIAKGFAPIMVYGIGSYTYQYVTRDTFGMAVKGTYFECKDKNYNIFKDPVTDDGTKKSAKGLLCVYRDPSGKLAMKDQCTKEEESESLLTTVFEDGKLLRRENLETIRERIKNA